jgi:hypothetical protein
LDWGCESHWSLLNPSDCYEKAIRFLCEKPSGIEKQSEIHYEKGMGTSTSGPTLIHQNWNPNESEKECVNETEIANPSGLQIASAKGTESD